eukprot:TRINITY_DN1464_c0_g1_i1.p1 TRINITY_DN1464_c0_g1~~TRINITY_DN1464_c0_g1_i1.p1  ORF type:complete len:274 (-),score=55.26 TRINITY_DN1464_c0_g1_i1:49-870(-)
MKRIRKSHTDNNLIRKRGLRKDFGSSLNFKKNNNNSNISNSNRNRLFDFDIDSFEGEVHPILTNFFNKFEERKKDKTFIKQYEKEKKRAFLSIMEYVFYKMEQGSGLQNNNSTCFLRLAKSRRELEYGEFDNLKKKFYSISITERIPISNIVDIKIGHVEKPNARNRAATISNYTEKPCAFTLFIKSNESDEIENWEFTALSEEDFSIWFDGISTLCKSSYYINDTTVFFQHQIYWQVAIEFSIRSIKDELSVNKPELPAPPSNFDFDNNNNK